VFETRSMTMKPGENPDSKTDRSSRRRGKNEWVEKMNGDQRVIKRSEKNESKKIRKINRTGGRRLKWWGKRGGKSSIMERDTKGRKKKGVEKAIYKERRTPPAS